MLLLWLALMLTARADQWEARWADAVRRAGVPAASVRWPLQATPEMADYAAEATRGCLPGRHALACLQRALLERGFTYAAGESHTAAEAFAARQGNCLAFTAMFVAMARTLGISAQLAALPLEPASGGPEARTVVLTRHLVVVVEEPSHRYVVDFGVMTREPVQLTVLSDAVISALYEANQAAWQLQQGAIEQANARLDLAAALAPEWPDIWINLGVARRHRGDLAGAQRAYARALVLSPGNPQALTNLAGLYGREGQYEQQRIALKAAARSSAVTPWALIALADAELSLGAPRAARRALRQARWQAPYSADVLAGLARWASATGDPEQAARYTEKAVRRSREGGGRNP